MRGDDFTVQVSERLPEQVNKASAEAIACYKCLPDLDTASGRRYANALAHPLEVNWNVHSHHGFPTSSDCVWFLKIVLCMWGRPFPGRSALPGYRRHERNDFPQTVVI